jgi:ion channel POLLUX/CASTOR
VAEIGDDKNIEAANIVGNNEASYVLSNDLIARITAQTCRQSGLSIIYTELLDFGGDEIYIKEESALVGKTFRDTLFAFETSAIMGLVKADNSVLINPQMNTKIEKGDQVIAVSADDDTVILSDKQNYGVEETAIELKSRAEAQKEKSLLLGWNQKGARILSELDNYVKEGSEAIILAEIDAEADIAALSKSLKKMTVKFIMGDSTDRKTIEEIDVPSMHQIIVLGYHGIDIQEADAKTLITLLHLRNLSEKSNKHFNIVSEMFDVKNRELAQVTKADDFIISENLISLMMSQLSENKLLKDVFDILFGAEGSEIYLKPIAEYVKPGSKINMYTLLEAASRKNEIALGYRLRSEWNNPDKQFGVKLNPNKAEVFEVHPEDKIIVLAEN